ncbi:MAG TPA: BNR-4 repeat-containing protein [Chthoniobacteraceae bacterium]|nr:BNR-4 repeat-containing protein [Chthoniobacteraceae bacterium]
MSLRTTLLQAALFLSFSLATTGTGLARETPQEPMRYSIPPVLSNEGGVYLKAEKGTLRVEVLKRDINQRDKYQGNLYAWLLSPDRQCVASANLQDDGSKADGTPGETTAVELKAEVGEPGIYLLMVSLTGFDGVRYDTAWGFSTNASKYVFARGETPGGRGKTPLVIFGDQEPGVSLWFQPTQERFSIKATALPETAGSLEIHPPEAKEVALAVSEKETRKVFTAKPGREPLWKIDTGGALVALDVEGLTSWHQWGGFALEDHGFFSFHKEAYLPVADLRWVLTPYQTIRELAPAAQKGELEWRMHNHASAASHRFKVEAVSPEGAAVALKLPAEEIVLAPGEDRTLKVPYEVAGGFSKPEKHLLRVTALDLPGYTTFGSIRFVPERKEEALKLPVAYKPFEHVAEKFGYEPGYPLNQVDFDPSNHPFVRQTVTRSRSDGVFHRSGGKWVLDNFAGAIASVLPGFQETVLGSTFYSTRTAFDTEGGVYTTVSATATGKASEAVRVLLHEPSPGGGFKAYLLDKPGVALADIEGFTGHNRAEGPPPVVIYTAVEHEKRSAEEKWRDHRVLELIVPEKKKDGSLSLEKRVVLSRNAINLCTHSGGASTIASLGNKIHVVYGEVTDEPQKNAGVPTYIVTYHRDSGQLEGPVFLGYAPPVNDMHNSSGIAPDSKGILHVVLGAHGKNPFHYVHSLEPNSISGGWSAPEVVLKTGLKANGVGPAESGAQTYVGLVCGSDDALHIAFRHDFQDVNGPFPGFTERYRALSVQRKPAGGPWEEATPMILPPLPGYSVYYHKLTVDRKGTLYLYFTYRMTHSIYRSENPATGNYAGLFKSSDGGTTWTLASDAGFGE